MVGAGTANTRWHLWTIFVAGWRTECSYTTDGHRSYLNAVEEAFGDDIDYGQLVKLYGEAPETFKGRYSPAECIGAKKDRRSPATPIRSTSARPSLSAATFRSGCTLGRFTRLTNAHSKKFENHAWAVSLHVMFYNFVRMHSTIRMSPAMAAGVADRLWEYDRYRRAYRRAPRTGKAPGHLPEAQPDISRDFKLRQYPQASSHLQQAHDQLGQAGAGPGQQGCPDHQEADRQEVSLAFSLGFPPRRPHSSGAADQAGASSGCACLDFWGQGRRSLTRAVSRHGWSLQPPGPAAPPSRATRACKRRPTTALSDP